MKKFEEDFIKIDKTNPEEAVRFLENYVTANPADYEAKLSLALCLQRVPIDDIPLSQSILSELLENDPLDIKAIILQAYIEDIHFGQIESSTYSLLQSLEREDYQSDYYRQIPLLKALYFRGIDVKKYIQNLELSVKVDPQASKNFILLGKETSNKACLETGLANIIRVFSEKDIVNLNPLDFYAFVQENIRGVFITKINHEIYIEDLKHFT